METILRFDLWVFTLMDKLIDQFSWLNTIMPYLTWPGEGYFWYALAFILFIPKKTRKIGLAMFVALIIKWPLNSGLKLLFHRIRPFALFNPEVALKCVTGYTDSKGNAVEGFMSQSYYQRVIDNMAKYSTEFKSYWLNNFNYPTEIGYHYSHGYSFPSGHTSGSFCAAFAMLLGCKGKKMKTAGWFAMFIALVVGFSRIYLHVHYCTDVIGGIVVGLVCGLVGWGIISLITKDIDDLTIDGLRNRSKSKEKAPVAKGVLPKE